MGNEDKEIQQLFGASYKTFEEHSNRIGEILKNVQKRFDKDYTSFTASVSIAMLTFSGVLIWFGKSEIFASILAISGGLFLATALFLRHKSSNKQIENAKVIIELEKERSKFTLRSGILQHMWLYGAPKNIQFDQVRFLLGDNESNVSLPLPTNPETTEKTGMELVKKS